MTMLADPDCIVAAGPRGRLDLSDGAYAAVEGDRQGQRLRVFSPRQELLFEYDAVTQKARITVPAGDLEVCARGEIAFRSARRLRFEAPEVALAAGRGDFCVAETTCSGDTFVGRFRHAKLFARTLETLARTVIERSRDLYRTVERLTQLQTGRLRTLVEGTWHLKARQTRLKAVEDVKVNGERIHLG